MQDILTAAQMRATEQAAIAAGKVTGLELMERAGAAAVTAIFEARPDLADAAARVAVLCGPGNNGGDGFVVARLLAARGCAVAVYLLGDAARLPADARANHDRWREIGPVAPLAEAPRAAGAADLFVDALFGTGLRRPLEGLARDWAATQADLPELRARTVALDLPSGLCSDSGRVLQPGAAVSAALTVTFHAPKPAHFLADAGGHCGHLVIADIGLEMQPVEGAARRVAAPSPEVLHKAAGAHKFTHGHALILTGRFGRTGAARLAARGALRIGAGLVTLGAPGAAQQEVAATITALMLSRVEGAEDLRAQLGDSRITALCLGPGLGHARARDLVPAAAQTGRAMVLDADALTAFADAPEALFGMQHRCCVMTPHAGEFARLFPDLAQALDAPPRTGPARSKIDVTRAAAMRAGCTVLFKGPDTVIADADGRVRVHAATGPRAVPWLASAGSGDVLAGFITGLLARGLCPLEAAQAAAWLHAECARGVGPGLIAEDIPERLPAAFRALGV